ncbi:MAG: NuoI/complex I 23 kDa subunit family protein [Candidatus Zixiibacteriota bacterium]
MGLFTDIKELLRGMTITGRHLGRHAITIQYPEERWEMPERSRGVVVLLSDHETGELNCTACELCMRACPTGAIRIIAPRGEDKKKVINKFDLDYGLCCYCGLCEEACNFSAMKMIPKYEFSTENITDTIWDIYKLQEVGLDADYVDTRKKKNPAPIRVPRKGHQATAPEQDKVIAEPTAQTGTTEQDDSVSPEADNTEKRSENE